MTAVVRVALGIALGLALAALPLVHYGALGGHDHPPTTAPEGETHASHAH